MTADPPVLVIDDDDTVRGLVAETLRGVGYRVGEAPDGETGLAMARAETPRLLILDLLLPDTDGWHVMAKLRTTAVLRQVPVLVVSIVDPSDLPAGVARYIVKPFSPSLLADTVAELSGPPGGAAA